MNEQLTAISSWRRRTPWIALLIVLCCTVLFLRLQGRLWWCACGEFSPWSSDVNGKHNSQHLFDPYSFTHILHGILLVWLLRWLIPQSTIPWRLSIALMLESAWEALENTEFIIQRYRSETVAIGYIGDSVINSLGDILCCAMGCALVRFAGNRFAVAFLILTEIILVLWIRDSLFLNILMLTMPLNSVKAWQTST